MANNGDVTAENIQDFFDWGGDFTEATLLKVSAICGNINADVNLIIDRLGFSLPITATNSVQWLELTKKYGATSLTMDLLMAQDSEEENTRSQRYWDRYKERLEMLLSSGGDILDADIQTEPNPNNVPVAISDPATRAHLRALRFPQRAAADQFTNQGIVRRSSASWKRAIRGL